MICEECWSRAFLRMLDHPEKNQAEHYVDIISDVCKMLKEKNEFSPSGIMNYHKHKPKQ